jgi:hypothetical protein
MRISIWTGAVSSDWNDPNNWNPAGLPDASSDVSIGAGEPLALASAPIGTVNSISDSSDLSFESAGTNTVTTFLDDAGRLWVDHNAGEGGTTLNIGGTLTNGNHLVIGNATLSAADEVTAASLDNTATGKVYLTGSSTNQALLDVSGSAGFGTAGVLSGYARLAGDSAIEFKSGEITSLAKGAHLGLVGSDAFIEDSTALGKNSALTGLASIGRGALFALHDGATVSTTGGLVNDGYIRLDTNAADRGGSSLTVGGTLSNSRDLICYNPNLSAPDEVTAAALDNTGLINLNGGSAAQALLDVTGSAGFGTAGVLSGDVILRNSAIEFGGGQITSVAGGLSLVGTDAFIEDSTKLGSNSALTGLSNVSGSLVLVSGASVSTKGALTNNGHVFLDGGVIGSPETSLTVGGALTNSGYLSLGTSQVSPTKVSTTALTNTGSIYLYADSEVSVSGATTNNGAVYIESSDTEELAGAVGGAGSFRLDSANLQFDSSVSAGQTITDGGVDDALTLEEAQDFAGTISFFGTGDTIDAANFLKTGTTFKFVENSKGTGGTLTLHDTTDHLTANIQMTGDYSNSNFTLASDGGTGTLVKFV